MSEEKKDSIDSFFDKVDGFVDKYVGKMSQVSTREKEEREPPPPHSPHSPPPQKQLANPVLPADVSIVDDDDAETIIRALKDAAGIYRQRSTSSALPERSRNIALANAAAAETIGEGLREKIAQGYHIILKR